MTSTAMLSLGTPKKRPSLRDSHDLKGERAVKRYLKSWAMTTATPKADRRVMTAYAILRKVLFERKSVM